MESELPVYGFPTVTEAPYDSEITEASESGFHSHSEAMESELPVSGSPTVTEDGFRMSEQILSDYNADGQEDLEQQQAESEQVQAGRQYDLQRLLQLSVLNVAITFAAILTVPGGLKDHGKHQGVAVRGKAFAFNIFLVADVVSLLASMIVAMIFGTMAASTPTKKLLLLSKTVLCVAVGLAGLASLAALYVVVPLTGKWIAVSVGVGTMAVVSSAFLYIISLG